MARLATSLAALTLMTACGAPIPTADGGVDAGTQRDGGGCAAYVEDVTACMPSATDYQPRRGMPGANGWPACISDGNEYRLVGAELPATVARIAAFESMAGKLWRNAVAPTPADFLSARDDYSVAQGLASRVARRQDVAYPEVPGGDKFACQSAGVPAQYPDRCAGPAKLKPVIDDAFVQAAAGVRPRAQAARIEAGLLWFLHLSMLSEVWTCGFSGTTDCDSSAAYYTGEARRDAPSGFAKYVAALSPQTHDRIFDALLAVRCWRDVDRALPAGNPALADRAGAQLAQASLRGIAVILRDRIGQLGCATGDDLDAAVEFVKTLGPFLDREASTRDATRAARLRAFVTAPMPDATAVAQAQADLAALFDCP